MPNPGDSLSYIADLVTQRLAETSTEKQKILDGITASKKSSLDPNYWTFDPDQVIVKDGDTYFDKRIGKDIRVGAADGFMLDTFETGQWPDGEPNHYYEKNPARFKAHAKAYARQAGRDIDEVTPELLYNAGRAQKQALQDNLENMRGQGFRLAGSDVYGAREVAVFENPANFDYISGLNAAYFSKYNPNQILNDPNHVTRAMGDQRTPGQIISEGLKNTVVEGLKIPGNLLGAGSMIAGATVGALGAEEVSDDLFHITDLVLLANKGLDKWKESWKSDGKKWQEQSANTFKLYVQDPLYNKRVADYEKAGANPLIAKSVAWLAGLKDDVGRLLDNPAAIADASIESLIYLVGSGAFSRMATKGLATELKILEEAGASQTVLKELQKKLMKRGEWAAVGFTAVTEGISNGMGAYEKVIDLPEETLLAESDRYNELLALGRSPDEAKREIAGQAGAVTTVATAILAGTANKLTGASKVEAGLFRNIDDLLTKGSKVGTDYLKTLPGYVAKPVKAAVATTKGAAKVISPARKEAIEELIQSGGGEITAQEAARALSGVESLRDPGASMAAAAAGLLAGAATGGTVGNISTAGKAIKRGYDKGAEALTRRADVKHEAVARGTRRATITNEPTAEGATPTLQTRERAKSGLAGNYQQTTETLKNSSNPGEVSRNVILEQADLFADATDPAKQSGEMTLKHDELVTYYDAHKIDRAKKPATTPEEKAVDARIEAYMDEEKRTYQFDLNALARAFVKGDYDEKGNEILAPLTPDEIMANPEYYKIFTRAVLEANFPVPPEWGKGTELRKVIDSRLSAESEILNAIDIAEDISEAAVQVLEEEEKKAGLPQETREKHAQDARQVAAEKLGFGRPNKLGLKGYAREAGIILKGKGSPSEKAYKFRALMGQLGKFISTQQLRVTKAEELVKIFEKNGRVTEADVKSVNKLGGYRVFWNQPRPDGSGGTPALLKTMREEFGSMLQAQRHIQEFGRVSLEPIPTAPAPEVKTQSEPAPKQSEPKAETATGREAETATQRIARKLVNAYSAKHTVAASRYDALIAFAKRVIDATNLDTIVPIGVHEKAILLAERLRRSKKGGEREVPKASLKTPAVDKPVKGVERIGKFKIKYDEAKDTLRSILAKGPGLDLAAWAAEGIDTKGINQAFGNKLFRKEGGLTVEDLGEFLRDTTLDIDIPTELKQETVEANAVLDFMFEVLNEQRDDRFNSVIQTQAQALREDQEANREKVRAETVEEEAPTEPTPREQARDKVGALTEAPYQGVETPQVGQRVAISWDINGKVLNKSGEIYEVTGVVDKGQYWSVSFKNINTGKTYPFLHVLKTTGVGGDLLLDNKTGLYNSADRTQFHFPPIKTPREQARQKAQNRIDESPDPREVYKEQTDNTNQGNAEADAAVVTQADAEPAMSAQELADYEAALDAMFTGLEIEQDTQIEVEAPQSGLPVVESPEFHTIFTEEEVEAQQVAWYELQALEEALQDMPDLRHDQVMFGHYKMYNKWQELISSQPNASTADLLAQMKAIAESTFSEEGKKAPETKVPVEDSADVFESAETLSDPTASIEPETTTTSEGKPGFLARMINYRMRKLLGNESQRSAIVGLWKLANLRRRERGEKELGSKAVVTKWLRDYNIAKADAALTAGEQTFTEDQRQDMQKPWRLFVGDVEYALKGKGLPKAVSAFLRPAKERSRNLLTRLAPVFSVLNDFGTRIQFFAKTQLVGRERMGMSRLVDYVNHFERVLQELAMRPITEEHKNSPYYQDRAGEDLPGIWQPLREYALHLLFESGTDTLHPNVAAAIALVAGEWATSTGTQSIFQKDDAINQKLGREQNEEITDEIRALFLHGTLVSNVVQDLGWRILRQLNLADAHAEGLDENHLERMATSLGLLALKGLEKSGRVEMYTLPRATMTKYSRKPEHKIGEGGFNLVRLALDVTTDEAGNVTYTESAKSRYLRTMYTMAGTTLKKYFNLETNSRGPHFEVPDTVKRIEGTYGNIPERMKKALTAASSREWNFIEDAFEEIDNFSRTEMLGMLGWVNPELIPELHKDERSSQESKNSTIERELDHALAWKATAGNLPFYFAYKLIRSARIYVDSNTVNPMSSKLHRFLVAQSSWAMEMPIGTSIEDPLRRKKLVMLKLAVMQGLGSKVERRSIKKSLELFEDMIAEDWFEQAIEALQKAKEDRTIADRAIIAKAVRKGGENMHSLLALKSWAKYQQALADEAAGRIPAQSLKITLPLEIDGVTNGFAIGLLQTPHGQALYNMLEAVGVYTKDSQQESFEAYIEADREDNYEQLMSGTNREFDKLQINGYFDLTAKQTYWDKFQLIIQGSSAEEDGQLSRTGFMFHPVGRQFPVTEALLYQLSIVELESFLTILEGDQWKSQAIKFVPSSSVKTKEQGRQAAIAKVSYLLREKAKSAAHFRQLFEVSPLALDRNFAKDPLMTAAYGAGMAAIKRALGRRAVKTFVEQLSNLELYATYISESTGEQVFVNSEEARLAYATFLARVNLLIETGRNDSTFRLTDAELSAWMDKKKTEILKKWKDENYTDAQINEKRKNFNFDMKNFAPNTSTGDYITREIIDPATEETRSRRVSIRELLSLEIADTLGVALTMGLKEKIGKFEETREMFNQGMQLSNLIFEENFRRLIELDLKTNGGKGVSNRRRKEILNDMVKQGLVPAVKTPLSESQLDALEITKYGKVLLKNDLKIEERGRAYFRTDQPHFTQLENGTLSRDNKNVNSITSIIEVLDVDADVGVAMLINLIHSSDAASMADILTAFEVLGVHDAIVGNPLDLLEAGTAANKSFFETQRNWNVGQEILLSLQKMITLMNLGDQRLSIAAKGRIMRNFAMQLEKGSHSKGMAPQDWITKFTKVVQDNNKARAELFSKITSIHQFAFPGTEYVVGKPVNLEIPNVDIATSMRTFIDAAIEAQQTRWEVWANENSKLVRENILAKEGNPQKVILELINQHQPSATALLDLLMQSVFHYDTVKESGMTPEAIDHIREVAAVIRSGLEDSPHRQIDIVVGNENTYDPRNTRITVNGNPEQFLTRLMHELIHAANWHRLEAIKKNDPQKFDKMLQETKRWVKAQQSATATSKSGKLRAMLEILMDADTLEETDLEARLKAITAADNESYRKTLADHYLRAKELGDGNVRAVAEFTAWLNTSLNATGSLTWSANEGAFKTLSQSLERKSGQKIYYSGPRGINSAIFQTEEGVDLNATTLQEVLTNLRRLDNLTPSQQDFYDSLVTEFIIPAMNGVDKILLKMVHDPNAENPEGALIADRGSLEIHIQTAGNRLSNPNMMSNQEALLHELFHAIMGHAIETNATIQNKMEKFYAQVLKRVNADGGWKVFAPENPTPEERELAVERFEYLFGVSTDATGRARLASIHLHEFAAIGLTDPFFRKYLENLTPDRENNWEDGFLTGLINIVRNAIQWFLGSLDGSNKNMYHALTKLAGQVSAQNIKYKRVSDQLMNETRIQQWLSSADNHVARLFRDRKNAHLRAWIDANSLSGPDLTAAMQKEGPLYRKLAKAAKSAMASGLDTNFQEFRNALEDAASGIQKDHWLYQLLTEIMPWSDKNHNWIDLMRESEKLVDMDRQQKIEHSRTALHHFMNLGREGTRSRFTNKQREYLSDVVLYTDLSSLLEGGVRKLTPRAILNMLQNPSQITARLQVLDGELTGLLEHQHKELLNLFILHSDGLARLMVNSESQGVALQTQNTHQIVDQWFYQNLAHRTTFDSDLRNQLIEILEHRTTLKALQHVPPETRKAVYDLMYEQMERTDTLNNGWIMFLNMHQSYKQSALENSFGGNPASMWKGYVYEVYDDDISIEIRPNTERDAQEMRSNGWRQVSVLPQDEDGPKIQMVMWAADRGISTYSKAILSLTDISSRGMSYFDIFFTGENKGVNPAYTAAQVYREKNARAATAETQVQKQGSSGNPLPPGVRMVPIFNPETSEVVDYRYVMHRLTKRKVLKRRDFYDELLPRMIASVADRKNTKSINRDAVEMLRKEYLANRLNDAVRFIRVGKNLPGIAGEMWKLLPEDTKQAAREAFGSDILYMRDDLVNLVMGFRKLSIANTKVLGPLAPAVRIAERIWQELIQWERFRIAVLNPAVVIGNMVSNIAVLLVHGVSAAYILRHWKEAVIGMRKFQRQTRQRNELNFEIEALRAQGRNTDIQQAELARLDYYLSVNPVKPLIDHGLFTNIVEEFGVDEKSYRRKYSNMLLDAAGGLTGSQGLIRFGQEAFMTPGSSTGNIALAATQYGDFVGRYLKYKWDTEVGRKVRVRKPTAAQVTKATTLGAAITTIQERIAQARGVATDADKAELFRLNQELQELQKNVKVVTETRLVDEMDAVRSALDTFIYYNIPQNKYLQWANDNGFMMFTKFFFRIQPIVARLFAHNPVRALAVFGAQSMTDIKVMGDSVSNYALMSGLPNKFNFNMLDHITGDTWYPSSLKWLGLFMDE